MKELIDGDGDDPEPSDRVPAGPLYVPVRPGSSGCTTRLFRTPLGSRTAVAFTSEERLTATLGTGQAWIRLAERALRALTEPLGVTTITVDPQFTAPSVPPVRQPQPTGPSRARRPQPAAQVPAPAGPPAAEVHMPAGPPAAEARVPAGPRGAQGTEPAVPRPAVPHHLRAPRSVAAQVGTAANTAPHAESQRPVAAQPRSAASQPRSAAPQPRSAAAQPRNYAPQPRSAAPQPPSAAPQPRNSAPRRRMPQAVGTLGLSTAVALIDALVLWAG